jgi:hypothetical protein
MPPHPLLLAYNLKKAGYAPACFFPLTNERTICLNGKRNHTKKYYNIICETQRLFLKEVATSICNSNTRVSF